MTENTKAIVLKAIKYGNTNLIVTCYTECCGVKSYLLKGVLKSKKPRFSPAYFQPLSQLNLVAYHNHRGTLNSIKEVGVSYFYTTLHSNVVKQSLVLFLTEVLYNSVKEETPNVSLFNFIENATQYLDSQNEISNFHIYFLLQLSKFLGFYPDLKNNGLDYFDLNNGIFVSDANKTTIDNSNLQNFKKILGMNFDEIARIKLSKEQRNNLLDTLLNYYSLHIDNFKKIKSLEVLRLLF